MMPLYKCKDLLILLAKNVKDRGKIELIHEADTWYALIHEDTYGQQSNVFSQFFLQATNLWKLFGNVSTNKHGFQIDPKILDNQPVLNYLGSCRQFGDPFLYLWTKRSVVSETKKQFWNFEISLTNSLLYKVASPPLMKPYIYVKNYAIKYTFYIFSTTVHCACTCCFGVIITSWW